MDLKDAHVHDCFEQCLDRPKNDRLEYRKERDPARKVNGTILEDPLGNYLKHHTASSVLFQKHNVRMTSPKSQTLNQTSSSSSSTKSIDSNGLSSSIESTSQQQIHSHSSPSMAKCYKSVETASEDDNDDHIYPSNNDNHDNGDFSAQQHLTHSISMSQDHGNKRRMATNLSKTSKDLREADDASDPAEIKQAPETIIMNSKRQKSKSQDGHRGEQQTENIGSTRKRKKMNPWGEKSYAQLIEQAILNSEHKRLHLSEIYDEFKKVHSYFNSVSDTNNQQGWKNSIRHNLSLRSIFVRCSDSKSRKSYWTLKYLQNNNGVPLNNMESNDCNVVLLHRQEINRENYLKRIPKSAIPSDSTIFNPQPLAQHVPPLSLSMSSSSPHATMMNSSVNHGSNFMRDQLSSSKTLSSSISFHHENNNNNNNYARHHQSGNYPTMIGESNVMRSSNNGSSSPIHYRQVDIRPHSSAVVKTNFDFNNHQQNIINNHSLYAMEQKSSMNRVNNTQNSNARSKNLISDHSVAYEIISPKRLNFSSYATNMNDIPIEFRQSNSDTCVALDSTIADDESYKNRHRTQLDHHNRAPGTQWPYKFIQNNQCNRHLIGPDQSKDPQCELLDDMIKCRPNDREFIKFYDRKLDGQPRGPNCFLPRHTMPGQCLKCDLIRSDVNDLAKSTPHGSDKAQQSPLETTSSSMLSDRHSI